MTSLVASGRLGNAFDQISVGYIFVYHVEILLLFCALVAIGPLVGRVYSDGGKHNRKFTMTEIPG